jgi:GNAT superfamily N-acetyltransferase
MPEYLGRGLGFFFLRQSIEIAWAKPISKFLVNTCTLDHPRALPLYQRAGFVPYSREDRYIELP